MRVAGMLVVHVAGETKVSAYAGKLSACSSGNLRASVIEGQDNLIYAFVWKKQDKQIWDGLFTVQP